MNPKINTDKSKKNRDERRSLFCVLLYLYFLEQTFLMRIFFGLLFIAFPMLTSADVEVQAWARATTPGSSSAAIYGVFKNTGAEVMSFSKINFAKEGINFHHFHKRLLSYWFSQKRTKMIA